MVTKQLPNCDVYKRVQPSTGVTPGAPNTYTVSLQNEYNAPSGGRVRGFETAYQQFFSFLPDPFDVWG